MNKNQLGITEIERPPDRPVFDGQGEYERCSKCAEVHSFGWPCYHCTVVRRNIRRRGFVNPITHTPSTCLRLPDDAGTVALQSGKGLENRPFTRSASLFGLNQNIGSTWR